MTAPPRLLVVSHTPHHQGPDGPVGWGPTVAELDHLARLFTEIVHVAPLHDGAAPASALAYAAPNVHLVPVQPAGGDGLAAKLGILAAAPGWWRTVGRAGRGAEAVHIRCPATISAVALLRRRLLRDRRPLWAKYAGNWRPDGGDPWSYRLQRRWLRRGGERLAVTVNGRGEAAAHVHPFANPSLTEDDLDRGRAAAESKAPIADGVRLAFVGRVEEAKGAPAAVRAAVAVRDAGHPVHLDVVGDGPARTACEAIAAEAGLGAVFHGWRDRHGVHDVLAAAHVVLLPSRASEGWPKVLSEAMAFGAVPVASAVSSVGQVLGDAGAGIVVEGADPATHAAAVLDLLADPERLDARRAAGLAAAPAYGFAAHVEAVAHLYRTLDLPLEAP